MVGVLQSLHAVERAFMQQREQYEAQARTEEMKREEDTRATVARLEERLHSVTRKLAATEEALEGSSGTFKQTKWEYEEQLEQRRRELERAQRDMQEFSDQRDALTRDLKSQVFNRDVELKVRCYSVSVQSLFSLCSVYVQSLFSLCSVSVQSMFSLCSVSVQYTSFAKLTLYNYTC